jgi:hypothetical protein
VIGSTVDAALSVTPAQATSASSSMLRHNDGGRGGPQRAWWRWVVTRRRTAPRALGLSLVQGRSPLEKKDSRRKAISALPAASPLWPSPP